MPYLEELENRFVPSTLTLAMKADEPERPESILADDSLVIVPVALQITEDHGILTFSYSHDPIDFTITIIADHGQAFMLSPTTVQLPLEATAVRIVVYGEEESEVTLNVTHAATAALIIGHRQLIVHLAHERLEHAELPEQPEIRELPERVEVTEVSERVELREGMLDEFAAYHQLFEDNRRMEEALAEAHWDNGVLPPAQRSILLQEAVRGPDLASPVARLILEQPRHRPQPLMHEHRPVNQSPAELLPVPSKSVLSMASLSFVMFAMAIEPPARTSTQWLLCA